MATERNRSQPPRVPSFSQLLGAYGPSNEDIKGTIANMYSEFVSNINVDGSVLDYLYQEGIITLHRKDKILSAPTSQSRTRSLLDKLLRSRNKVTFIVLREALKRDYHWFVKTIDTEIAAQAHQQAMMNEHRALIDKLQQDNRKLEDKVLFYKDCLLENWRQTENTIMVENAWLKEKLRQKESKLDKATEQMTKLLLEHQRIKVAHHDSSKRLAQLLEENKTLEDNIKQLTECRTAVSSTEIDMVAVIRDVQQHLGLNTDTVNDKQVSESLLEDKSGVHRESSTPLPHGEIRVADEDEPVDGVAYLDGCIYAVRRHGAGLIRVFNDRPPYNSLSDIIVKGLTEPRDLAACSDYHCLYVSDCNSCVWKVKVDGSHSQLGGRTSCTAERWLTGIGWPARLSVTGGHLLVISNGGLNVFGPFGPSGQYQQPMLHIKLPVGMLSPWHAVEMPRKVPTRSPSSWCATITSSTDYTIEDGATFMVCHGGGGTDWPQNYISEVTCDRRMMRSYGGEHDDQWHRLGKPICVATASDTILVADWGAVDGATSTADSIGFDEPDAVAAPRSSSTWNAVPPLRHDRSAGRVMVFDSELRLTRVLPVTFEPCTSYSDRGLLIERPPIAPRPTRLCYVPHKGVLLIGTECGRVVVRPYPDRR